MNDIFWQKNMKRYFWIQNVNTISFSEMLLKTLNATWNASQDTILPNNKNYLMSKRQTLPKTLLPNTLLIINSQENVQKVSKTYTLSQNFVEDLCSHSSRTPFWLSCLWCLSFRGCLNQETLHLFILIPPPSGVVEIWDKW